MLYEVITDVHSSPTLGNDVPLRIAHADQHVALDDKDRAADEVARLLRAPDVLSVHTEEATLESYNFV